MKPLDLLNKHCIFANEYDVYVLLGVARKKDNKDITNSQEVVFREIIKSKENIEHKYLKIITQCASYITSTGEKLNFYIYVSVNGRDVRKGYITFKNMLLAYERELMFGISCSNQFKRLDSIWVSSMMKPESRSLNNKRFMLDIDTKEPETLKAINDCLQLIIPFQEVLVQETKNGYHYVTCPFDKKKFMDELVMTGYVPLCTIKHDALLFIEHIKGDTNGN